MNNFKIGDRVKLVKMEDEGPWYKKYLGDFYTIKNFETDNRGRFAILAETSDIMPYVKNLELVKDKYTHEDLKKASIGTKLIFENGYLIKFDNERVYGVINGIYYNGRLDYIILFMKGKVTDERFGKIIKIEKPIYETVYEHKEEILDEEEKRYLRVVIRPFKNRVRGIEKISYSEEEEFITIIVKDDGDINLPTFKRNTMYKGMEPNKEYTLEELGL